MRVAEWPGRRVALTSFAVVGALGICAYLWTWLPLPAGLLDPVDVPAVVITDRHGAVLRTTRADIMFEGRLLIEGSAEHLAQDEEARRIYLGKSFSL